MKTMKALVERLEQNQTSKTKYNKKVINDILLSFTDLVFDEGNERLKIGALLMEVGKKRNASIRNRGIGKICGTASEKTEAGEHGGSSDSAGSSS